MGFAKAKIFLTFTIVFATQFAFSEEKTSTESKNKDNAPANSQEWREKTEYVALLNYAPIDLVIPSKTGFTLSLIRDVDLTWDFEYLNARIAVPFLINDLGEMSDSRYALLVRSYFGANSFNLSYGVSYFDFNLHLGDALLNKITSGQYPSIDVVQLQALGANIGIGNRWTFSHQLTLGIDWLSWAQPLYVTSKKSAFLDYATDAKDRDDVKKALNVVSYFPRLTFLKIQFGMAF